MNEIIGAHCGHSCKFGKHMVCASFYNDVRKGAIRIDQERGGWVDLLGTKRGMSRSLWIYKANQRKRGIPDMEGEDFLLTEICPRCGGELAPVSVKNAVTISDEDEC